jgi:hypothetical protein
MANIYPVVRIDFDNDGDFTTSGDDISGYVNALTVIAGMQSEQKTVASVGQATLTLVNTDKRFSPAYTGGTYYGKLLPNLPVQIQMTDGTTVWDWFRGKTRGWTPSSGAVDGDRTCELLCEDILGDLRTADLTLPLQENMTADWLLQLVTSAAMEGDTAVYDVKFTGQPQQGETVTVYFEHPQTGTQTQTYQFVNALGSSANQVLIGASKEATADNFAAAINTAETESTVYTSATRRQPYLTAGSRVAGTTFTGGTQTIYTGSTGEAPIGNKGGTAYEQSQTFSTVTTPGLLTSLVFNLDSSIGSPTGTLTWGIYAGISPTSNADDRLRTGTLTPNPGGGNTVTLGTPFYANASFSFKLSPTSAQSSGNYWRWDRSGSSQYASGALYEWSGTSWTDTGYDANLIVTVASVTEAEVPLTAVARGTWPHSTVKVLYTGRWSRSSAHAPASGRTEDGSDEPAGLTNFDTGVETIELAADTWSHGQTNALRAIQDIVTSEPVALFYANGGGTLIYKDRLHLFKQVTAATALVINDTASAVVGRLALDETYTRAVVTHTPRRKVEGTAVIARAGRELQVPARAGRERWNPTERRYDEGYYVNVPFIESDTGQIVGATDIITPQAGTDYEVTDGSEDPEFVGGHMRTVGGAGVSRTLDRLITISAALTGGNIELSITSRALGALYLRGLQVRGRAIRAYETQDITREDGTAIASYGVREYRWPLPLSTTLNFAAEVANYFLTRYKTPTYRVQSMRFTNKTDIGGTVLYGKHIGDMIDLTESQLGVSQKVLIIGIRSNWQASGVASINWFVRPLTDKTYWILNDNVYGRLGSTTRLAI